MNTATEMNKLDGFTGDARLYRLDPPVETERHSWTTEADVKHYEYVIVSAVNVMFSGPETYIFGADSKGEIQSWSDLNGSFQGDLDHVRALKGAGYEVVTA